MQPESVHHECAALLVFAVKAEFWFARRRLRDQSDKAADIESKPSDDLKRCCVTIEPITALDCMDDGATDFTATALETRLYYR